MVVRSKKPKEVPLVKWLIKKSIEKIQEEHQQGIEEKETELVHRDNQIQALEFKNEAYQQKILRLNEEIDDLIGNRHVTHRACFDNVLCSSKIIAKKFTHITLYDVNIDSLKNISDGLNFFTQTWRWLTNAMIQMPFTDGTSSSVK